MVELKNNKDKLEYYSDNTYRYAVNNYSWSKIVKESLIKYEEIIKKNGWKNMYLYERIIGISVYVVITFIMILAIYKSDKSKLKKILTIYLFFLCILAFFYIPSKTDDLYRYIISAKYYNSI